MPAGLKQGRAEAKARVALFSSTLVALCNHYHDLLYANLRKLACFMQGRGNGYELHLSKASNDNESSAA